VIGNVIENIFGGEETARYAIALATGQAQLKLRFLILPWIFSTSRLQD